MSRRILIVDDDPNATRLIEYSLKQHGYQVLTTQNGLEGIMAAQREEPDLIILNVMLPGIDGFEVCRRLRAGSQTAQTPILILSGKAQQEDIATGLKMGADDYLTKPAAPSDILTRVKNLLSERTDNQSKVFAFIGSKEQAGTTTMLDNLAIAITQMGKQVILVDLCHSQGTDRDRNKVTDNDNISNLLEIDKAIPGDLEPALEMHPTGVRRLRLRDVFEQTGNTANANIDLLLQKLGEVTDYLLIDLPFQPSAVTRSILMKCDMAVIVSNHEVYALAEVRHIITLLRFLGLSRDRIATVIIDTAGTFPGISINNIKSYIEVNIGVTLIGAIPYDANSSVQASPASQSLILSSPDCPLVYAIKSLAQLIVAPSITRVNPHEIVTNKIEWEKINVSH